MLKNRLSVVLAISFSVISLFSSPMSMLAKAQTVGERMEEEIKIGLEDRQLETETKEEQDEHGSYYDDISFNEYFEKEKQIIINGTKDESQNSLRNLYSFALQGGMSEEQLIKIINEGFLVDNIEMFKAYGRLPLDFTPTIKEGISIYSYEINKDAQTKQYSDDLIPTEDPVKTHNFEEISDDAEICLLNSTTDFYDNNTFIKVKTAAQKKVLDGNVMNAAVINGAELWIDFTDDDYKTTYYRWNLTGWMVPSTSEYDLGIEYDETHIHFNAQQELPVNALVSIKMEKPETNYNLFYPDGKYIDSYTSDKNGYIVFYVKDAMDFKVSNGEIPASPINKVVEDVQNRWENIDFNEPSVWIIFGLEIILFVLVIYFVVKGVINSKIKITKKRKKR